jgi:hypothetical protein
LCGIALAVWGGYTIATKNSEITTTDQESIDTDLTMAVTDTSTLKKPDSSALEAQVQRDNYKYILELAKGKRAMSRYNQLKDNRWDVQMETSDSVQYKLFMILPATSDTAWKMDSLTALSGKRVYIENHE